MTAQLLTVKSPTVFASDGVVHIQDLAISDPEMLALVVDAANPVDVVYRALTIGARALAVSQVTMETAVIEKSFGTLVDQLTRLLDNATGVLAGSTSSLLNDPESGVHASLNNWKRDVGEALNAIFDPERSTSAIGKLDAVMQSTSERQLAATRRMLNPENEDSPLFRLFSGVHAQIAMVLDSVARVAEQVAADKATVNATALALARSAVKGMVFEDQVALEVTRLAANWGDVAEAVGRTSGANGSSVGDVVVELGTSDADGRPGRYVLECKDRRLSLKATLNELRRAAVNRESTAAIAVFARNEQAPIPEPFAVFDDLAIVVYDNDDLDPAALRLACAWARWVVRRQPRSNGDSLDVDLIQGLLHDARRALDRVANIRRAHSSASKKINEASAQVSELSSDLTDVLDKVEQALRR